MQRLIPTLVTASLLASGPGVANATATPLALVAPAEESFESLTEQASEKYAEQDYAGAIALFERAYALEPEPNILFNIGRIHEEAGQLNDAITYYERFISDPQVDIEDKQVALRRRDIAREIVAIREKDEAAAKPPTETTPPPTETTPPPTETTPPPGGEPGVDDRPKPRNVRPIGYALVGTGGAALIAGAIVGGLAKRQESLFNAAESRAEANDAKAQGMRMAPAADGLFIAGGILAAAGIVMLVLPKNRKKADSKAPSARIVPQTSPTQVGLGVIGRF